MFQSSAQNSQQQQGGPQGPNQPSQFFPHPPNQNAPAQLHPSNPRFQGLPHHMGMPMMGVPPNYQQYPSPFMFSHRANAPNHFHQMQPATNYNMQAIPFGAPPFVVPSNPPPPPKPQQQERKSHAIDIVDPTTGESIWSDNSGHPDSSSPGNPENNDGNTTTPNVSTSNPISMEFATKVAAKLSDTETSENDNTDPERTTNKSSEINSNIVVEKSRQLSVNLVDNLNTVNTSMNNCNTNVNSESVDTTDSNNVKYNYQIQQQQQINTTTNTIRHPDNKQLDNVMSHPQQQQQPPQPMPQQQQQQRNQPQKIMQPSPPRVQPPQPQSNQSPQGHVIPPPHQVTQIPTHQHPPHGHPHNAPPQVHQIPPQIPNQMHTVVAHQVASQPHNQAKHVIAMQPSYMTQQQNAQPPVVPVIPSDPVVRTAPPPKVTAPEENVAPPKPKEATPPPVAPTPKATLNTENPTPTKVEKRSPSPAVAQPTKEATPEPVKQAPQKQAPASSVPVSKHDSNSIDASKKGVSNHVNNDEYRRKNPYKGSKSKDNKNARRGGKGPTSNSPPRVPREQTPVANSPPRAPREQTPVANEGSEKSLPPQIASKEPTVEVTKPAPKPAEPVVNNVPPVRADSASPSVPEVAATHQPTPPPPEQPKVVESQPPSPVEEKAASKEPTPERSESKEPKEVEKKETESVKSESGSASATPSPTPKPEAKYSYKEGQWSPFNQAGKKQYDRTFLIGLQTDPQSMVRPESLPNLEVVLHENQVGGGYGGMKAPDLRMGGSKNMTDFFNTLKSADSLAPNYVKGTRSMKGNKPMSGGRPSFNNKNARYPLVIPRLSTEKKLTTAGENAWKPSVKDKKKSVSDEESITNLVMKKMRGILNKLTPDNFDKLSESVRTLPHENSEARISGIINLVFEKAVDEQGFSTTYARLCKELTSSITTDFRSFRFLIINRCQQEFETDSMEKLKEEWDKKIAEEADPEKKIELKLNYEFEEMKLRKRSVGNVRFIGELYKLKMLNSPVMLKILGILASKADSESLECLCKLLTTIGGMLESSAQSSPKAIGEINELFDKMKDIINSKSTSSRVRFLMMDVVDLRKNNWVARREEAKPKTKAQVHEDIKKEEEARERDSALAQMNQPRRDDRGGGKRSMRNDNRGGFSDNMWSFTPSTKKMSEASRLSKMQDVSSASKDFGYKSPFGGSWGHGSSGGVPQQSGSISSNRYNILAENAHEEKEPAPQQSRFNNIAPSRQAFGGSKSMPPLHDKEDSFRQVIKSPPPSPTSSPFKGPEQLFENSAKKYGINIVEEYVNIKDYKEAELSVYERFHEKTIHLMVFHAIAWVIDKNADQRNIVGQLFQMFIKNEVMTVSQFIKGNENLMENVPDLLFDVPKLCDYYADIYAAMITVLPLVKVYEMVKVADRYGPQFLACVIKRVVELKIMSEDEILVEWSKSGLQWSDILPKDRNVDEFLKRYNVSFLTSKPLAKFVEKYQIEDMQKNLKERLKKEESNDLILSWISEFIEKNIQPEHMSKCIRALVNALVEFHIISHQVGSVDISPEKLKLRLPIIYKFITEKDELEVQCIFELQAITTKLQHPKGFLGNLLHLFYENDIITDEAVTEWEKYDKAEEQEGRFVCLNSVKEFLGWIKSEEPPQ